VHRCLGIEPEFGLRDYLAGMRENMLKMVTAGMDKSAAVTDKSFDQFFFADTKSGAYWARQREQTFREGLEKLYDHIIKGGSTCLKEK